MLVQMLQHLPGIQPTYEELKQVLWRAINGWPTCIQPTYEELKQALEAEIAALKGVSSLPMRN